MDLKVKSASFWVPLLLGIALPAWSQVPIDHCTDDMSTSLIEVLPFFSVNINSCPPSFHDDLGSYNSTDKTCRLSGTPYPGSDTIYKVSLNPGNEVSFRLQSQ